MSASCTHVSALLHALVAMSPTEQFPHASTDDIEDDLPCTSYPCQWKKPRSRKETNLKISDAKVEKHKYTKEISNQWKTLIHGLLSTEELPPSK